MSNDFLNPVLLKEMRQFVRSRSITACVVMTFALLVFDCFFLLIYLQVAQKRIPDGKELFGYFLGATFFMAAGVVIVNSVERLVKERFNGDMMYFATLRPMRIALGKFLAGIAIAWLLFWIIAGALAVLVSGCAFDRFFKENGIPICAAILYAFNYAVTAIWLRERLQRNGRYWVPKEATWGVALGLLGVGVLLSILLWSSGLWPLSVGLILTPCPLTIFDGANASTPIQFCIAGFWFIALLPLVGGWIRGRFDAFVPLEDDSTGITEITAANAVGTPTE